MEKDKQCPQCGAMHYRIARRCGMNGCPYVFSHKKRKPYKKSEPEIISDDDASKFAVGIADDGGLLVFWYGKGEFTKFTPEQTKQIKDMFITRAGQE